MREELLLVKEIYSSKQLANRDDAKRIYNVLLASYIKACLLRKAENFVLIFDGKYTQTRKERVCDWGRYVVDKCSELFYKTFMPNNDRTLRRYQLIHSGAIKPIHVKVSNCPNEQKLEKILTRHGFIIVEEHLFSITTEYVIARGEPSAIRNAIRGAKKMSNKDLTQ